MKVIIWGVRQQSSTVDKFKRIFSPVYPEMFLVSYNKNEPDTSGLWFSNRFHSRMMTDPWMSISCAGFSNISSIPCPGVIARVLQNIYSYNKFYWVPLIKERLRYERNSNVTKFIQNYISLGNPGHAEWYELLRKVSIEDVLNVLLFSETGFFTHLKLGPYEFRSLWIFTPFYNERFEKLDFTRWTTSSYNFLSCHNVKRRQFAIYSFPFDSTTWILIGFSLPVIFLATKENSKTDLLFDLIVLAGNLIEISNSQRKQRPINLFLLWVWIFCAMVLTTWYKTLFTSDAIQPFETYADWKSALDLIGFQILTPLEDSDTAEEEYKLGNPYAYRAPLLNVLTSGLKSLKKFKEVENYIYEQWKPYSGESFGYLHYKYWEHFINNVTNEKMAYVDTSENIDNLLPFINEKGKHFNAKFLKGEHLYPDFLESFQHWRLLAAILFQLAREGWQILQSLDPTRKQNDKDTMFFEIAKPDPHAEIFVMSFNRFDRIRLINPPNSKVVDTFKATVSKEWPPGICGQRIYYGADELELFGNPWATRKKEESIAAKQLVAHLIYAMKRIGYKLYAAVDITGRIQPGNSNSRKNGSLDVLAFRKVSQIWGN
ncbi:hypothetical protein Fcan01_15832 [Folsomia candida]|uniref:Uncharacterized protein n=1 Tax=Folsomia candida TaxID=158441 RepID=A0A226DY30_FOLCA|nr:hypothetical protein Fcan01_15832 [Folsomia candida]